MDIRSVKRVKNPKILGSVLLVIVCAGAGYAGGIAGSNSANMGFGSQDLRPSQQIVLNESQLISDIVNEVGPSVVSVNVVSQQTAQSFFGFGQTFEAQSAGTGFIIRDDGIIVTNRHVIPANASQVTITLADGTELEDVEVIGRTAESDPLDVAFLKVNDRKGKDLKSIKIGDSSKVRVGDKVIAIGNALGQFQNTVTSGIISGFGRNVQAGTRFDSETLQNLFQTDASINQGNSGGPLVNMNGEVIGINTAIAGNGAENIGFSIPINDTKGLIDGVLETGQLQRPYLGIRHISLTDDLAFQFELGDTKRGAYLLAGSAGQPAVLPGSPAEKAGLEEGDVITEINSTAIDENNSLVSLVGANRVGQELRLKVIRDGSERNINVTLESTPD